VYVYVCSNVYVSSNLCSNDVIHNKQCVQNACILYIIYIIRLFSPRVKALEQQCRELSS
jgi:hypothetical protein